MSLLHLNVLPILHYELIFFPLFFFLDVKLQKGVETFWDTLSAHVTPLYLDLYFHRNNSKLDKKKKKKKKKKPSYMMYSQCPGGHSYMLVDISCLTLDPPFPRQSYHQWPPFPSVHNQWSLWVQFCNEFYKEIKTLCALCAHFDKICNF